MGHAHERVFAYNKVVVFSQCCTICFGGSVGNVLVAGGDLRPNNNMMLETTVEISDAFDCQHVEAKAKLLVMPFGTFVATPSKIRHVDKWHKSPTSISKAHKNRRALLSHIRASVADLLFLVALRAISSCNSPAHQHD
eukprot:TRINITY_DN7296_c0_g1_i3.p2 TRINITY_DN7296_c0_g1~~TRINITY_DN7296_c0_g1_i3.p2  ORF type:complete len:138 (-),score=16.12 TRINITY_DN7296_c0_g1_i3:1209-1622(-)